MAFSGTVHDTDVGRDYTENGMNNLAPSVSIADTFKRPEYRILIVANKFLTGFDEPLLQTMYVDKRLDGLQCVQSLESPQPRRTGQDGDARARLCERTDDDIQAAFQQYYEATILEEETDPNRLYDLQRRIGGFRSL